MRVILMIFCCFVASAAFAAEPMSTQPHINPVPGEFGTGNEQYTVPLPPSFPQYLPNGAVNLDEAWIQDGGARYYWNLVIVPRQLKMGGNYWVDPALVPQLTVQPQKKSAAPRYRVVRRPRAKAVSAPADAASRSLRAPTVSLSVEPVPGKTAIVPPPFSPSQTRSPISTPDSSFRSPITPDTSSPVQPPRLQ